jgi:putative NADH-flavin reductase
VKILLLGATGKVGRLILAQALAQGHDVVAFVRDPAKIPTQSTRLTFFKGDARDPRAVASAMARTDAVMSALGHNSLAKSDVQTAATRAVLANIKPGQRFISLTGQGVTDPKDPPQPLASRLITLGIKLVPGEMYLDGARHADLLRHSSADWILVRSPIMTGGAPTKYRTGYFKLGLTATAVRADVADFMLANLTTNQWLRQMPLIASR